MTNKELIEMAEHALDNVTMYVKGCIGSPLTENAKKRAIKQYRWNAQHKDEINACDDFTFGFDCICFVKALLWGWNGNFERTYGGAVYQSNGYADLSINAFKERYVPKRSTSVLGIEVGEMLFMEDHCGLYAGDNKVIEATYGPDGIGVVETRLTYREDGRHWREHGRISGINYVPEKNLESEIILVDCDRYIEDKIKADFRGMEIKVLHSV